MKLSDDIVEIELKGGNAYLIHGAENILIDTGLPTQRDKLLSELKSILGENARLDAILLTHHDVDHVGNLCIVQEVFGGAAYISSLDAPYVLGQKKRPGIKHIIEKVIHPAVPQEIWSLSAFESTEIQVISTPGHTPGHSIFRYRDYLFTGDLFKIADGHAVCMKQRMNWDNTQLANSIQTLLGQDAKWLCPAHGNCVAFDKVIKAELKKVGEEYGRISNGKT